MKSIKFKMNLITALVTAAVIACLVIFNMTFGIIADKAQLDIDLTEDNVYEFSELTKTTIGSLKQNVNVYLLEYDGKNYAHLKQLLEKYATMSERIKLKKINPFENPEIMEQFPNLSQSSQNPTLVVVQSGELYRGITAFEIFPQSFNNETSLDGERQITNGIRYVIGELNESVIAFTIGHKEDNAVLINRMIDEGYRYSELDLKSHSISEETSVVISYMPMEDFAPGELETLQRFTDNGGKFVLISSSQGTGENLQKYINNWGIAANRDFVLESPDNYIFHEGIYSGELFMQSHPVTNALIKNEISFLTPLLPNTLTLSNSSNGAIVTPLLKSSPDSYAKLDALSDDTEYESGDPVGPFVMGAISEEPRSDGAVCVLSGGVNASFASEEYVTNSSIANYDFTLNLINYLGGTSVESGIRAKNISPDSFTLKAEETTRISVVLIVVIPLLVLMAAFVVWIRRRFR